jgi:hypothetical protein
MNVLLVLLGWLLGLFTPQIVDSVRRRYDRARMAAALTSELREISERLAGSAYYIWSEHGRLSPDGLEWIAATMERAEYHPRHRRIALTIRKLIAQGPEYLQRQNAAMAADSMRHKRKLNLRRIETPYLTSVLPRVDVFPRGARQALLSIDAQFKIYNEIVEECREYGRLTFNQAITGENREAVLRNLKEAENALAHRAHYITVLIGNLDLNARVATAEILDDEPPALNEQADVRS